MSTTTPLTDAINALTTYANETTGASDTDLSSAVATLVAGYGGGGDDYNIINQLINKTLSVFNDDYSGAVKHDNLFYGQTNLTQIIMPNCTSIGASAQIPGTNFARQCTSLTYIDMPSLEEFWGGYTFYQCTALTTVVLPSLMFSYNHHCFGMCTNLTHFDCGKSSITGGTNFSLGQNFLNGCSSLTSVIIRHGSVLPLSNVNVFSGTPFASGGSGGTIYVPSDLISTYQSTSPWSTLDGYGTVTWTAIEGSDYENYYADGTAIS